MKLYTIFAIPLLIFGLSNPVQAQKIMNLEECIKYARENNLSVQQSELNVNISESVKSSAFGNFLPNFGLNGSYSYNKGFAIDPTTNQIQSAVQSFVFSASSSWDIFTGLRNLNSYRKAKFDLLASQYNLEQLKDEISLQVADAYLQIILQKEFLTVAQNQVQLSTSEVERVTKLVESGSRPKGDLYEILSTLANDEQQLVSVENNLLLAKLNLSQLLQIQFSEDFDIADTEFPVPSLEVIQRSNDEVYDKAISSQYLIKSQESRISAAEKDYNMAIGAYMPSVSLVYSFSSRYTLDRTKYLFSNTPVFPVIGQVPSTGENVISIMPQYPLTGTENYPVWDQFNDNKNHYFGVNVNIPIFNRLQTRNNVKIKKLQLESAKLDLDIKKNQIRQNIEKAHADANASLKSYDASAKALESLEEAFKYAQQKKEVGVISEYDYNASRNRLISAQSSMIRAKYDFIFKIKVLEFYYGNRFGVDE